MGQKMNLPQQMRLKMLILSMTVEELETKAREEMAANPVLNEETAAKRQAAAVRKSDPIPELSIAEEGDVFKVYLNNRSFPSLTIDSKYRKMAENKIKKEEKKFLNAKLNQASMFLESIEYRKRTLLKTMKRIVELQNQFFKTGNPADLKHLIRQDVANLLNMSCSVVARAVTGHYVQTKFGVLDLNFFFAKGIKQADNSEIPRTAIKLKVRKMIEDENPSKPLSDQKIADKLKSELGIKASRRVVAKYRDEMGIKSSQER